MQLLIDINRSGRTIIMATHNYQVIKRFAFKTLKCENSMLTLKENEEIEFDFL